MGWEFAALFDDKDHMFYWIWRRIADDSGHVIDASATRFPELEPCMDDARRHGFRDSTPTRSDT